MSMTEGTQKGNCRRDSIVLDAVLVPVLVVMIQAVYAARGNGFRNAFLGHFFHPVILLSCAAVAVISFFVLRAFARRKVSRRVAFSVCVAVFTAIALVLTPGIVE